MFYILDKGVSKQADLQTKDSVWIAAVCGLGTAIASIFVAGYLKRRQTRAMDAKAADLEAATENGDVNGEGKVAVKGGEGAQQCFDNILCKWHPLLFLHAAAGSKRGRYVG